MSPEQAKGKETDRTADVWALACVLYEMLTGHAVFEGETAGEILAEVFKAEPDWHRLPADTPEGVRRLLRRGLQKERKQRLQHIGDARIEIDEAQIQAPVDGHVGQRAVWQSKQFAWTALMIVTIIAVVLGIRAFRPLPAAPEMRLEINSPPTADPVSLAISPDGQKIVFIATSEGVSRLWLRSLDSVSVRPLMGTDSASYPFWSPDSRS